MQRSDPQITTERRSGAWLFAITAEGIDLTPQLLNALLITAGDRHGESEFQLFVCARPTLACRIGLGEKLPKTAGFKRNGQAEGELRHAT